MSRRARWEDAIWLISLLIFGGALAVRLIYLDQLADTPFADERELLADGQYYDMRGREIASGDWIGDAPGFLSPLYCLVVGVVYAVAGPGVWAVKLLQAVLGSLSCVLLYLVGRRAFGAGVGLAGAVLLALYSPHVYYHGLLLPATLVVFLHLLLVWIAMHGLAPWRAGLAGIVIGLAIAAKSNAALLLPAIALAAWLAGADTRTRIRAVAFLVLGAVLMVAPVTIANYAVSHAFLPLTTTGGSNLLKGNGPTATGTHAFLPRWAEATGLSAHVTHQVDAQEAILQSRELTSRTLGYMASHPLRTARLWAKKLRLLFNARELGIRDKYDFAREHLASLRFPLLTYGLVLPFGVLGAYVAWPRRRELSVLYLVLLVQVVSFVIVFVLGRYRLPFIALLMPFAAHAVWQLVARARERDWTRLVAALLILAGVAGIAHAPLAELPRDHGYADQYKFIGDARFAAADFEDAASAYAAALDATWQDEIRSTGLRWDTLQRLALARLRLGQPAAAREPLERLLAEMEASSADAGTIEPVRTLLRQIDDLIGETSDQNPQAPVDEGSTASAPGSSFSPM